MLVAASWTLLQRISQFQMGCNKRETTRLAPMALALARAGYQPRDDLPRVSLQVRHMPLQGCGQPPVRRRTHFERGPI